MEQITTGSIVPGMSEAIDEFFQDPDIEMCITLLKIGFCTKILELGIKDSQTLVHDVFSDGDSESWSKTEWAWANIIRNSRGNINYLLKRREDLLRKDWRNISSEDEEEYDKLGRKLDMEVLTAKQLIEKDMERILSTMK